MCRSGGAGFSLLEAVVALAILSLAAVGTLGAMAAELRTLDRTRRALEAQLLAEDRMAALRLLHRAELSPLPDSLRGGRFPPPFEAYRWEAASRDVPGRRALFELRVAVGADDTDHALVTRVYRP
jgi:prepilin-type N-terminal cleavage/methylation domain-containing protein